MGGPRAEATPPGPDADFWYRDLAGYVGAGGNMVTADSALRSSAVFACVKVISEDVASLPMILYRRLAAGRGRDRADDLPLSRTLRLEPNRLQSSMEWREMCEGHLLLRGNAINVIVPDARGFVGELIPLNPDRVDITVLPNRVRVYTYRPADGSREVNYLDSEIFHVPGMSFDGVKGLSPITYARETIAASLAAQRSQTALYDQGLKAPGVLQHAGKLSDDAYKRVRETFAEANLGVANFHKPILLEEGMTWQTLGMTSEDAQFIETYKHTLEDIARYFRMKPHKIGILDHATFSNIEQENISYVIDTLRPWLVRWEMRASIDLIYDDRLFVEFLVDALLRGDIQSRYTAFQIARQNGTLSANEWRERENQNPIDGGDVQWRPLNMANADDPTPAQLAQTARSTRGATSRAALFAGQLATRLVRKELDRVAAAAERHAADGDGWATFLADFYGAYAEEIARTLGVGEEAARTYTDRQVRELRADGVACIDGWLADRPAELVGLAMAG